MAAKIKIEPIDYDSSDSSPETLEERFIEICGRHPKGITAMKIAIELQISNQQCMDIVNSLSQKRRISLLQTKRSKEAIIKLTNFKDTTTVAVSKVVEEQVIFDIIKAAGCNGIDSRSITRTSNLTAAAVKKVLDGLTKKNLVKGVTAVNRGRSKLYMLCDEEASETITGGPWYSGQDFDSEFVEILMNQCYKYLQKKADDARQKDSDPIVQKKLSSATAKDIVKFISDLRICTLELTTDAIESLLNALVFDGRAEQDVEFSGTVSSNVNAYRVATHLLPSIGIVQIPCTLCRVRHNCGPRGAVTPAKCVYLNEWLQY